MEMAKVTSKGQITIPVSIRRRLKINEGDKLLFIDRPDGVMMVNPGMLESAQSAAESESKENTGTAKQTKDKPHTNAIAIQKPQTEITVPAYPKKPDAAVPKTAHIPEDSKPGKSIGAFNIDALLDEIRSIGSKF